MYSSNTIHKATKLSREAEEGKKTKKKGCC